jgi:hypothetical protein
MAKRHFGHQKALIQLRESKMQLRRIGAQRGTSQRCKKTSDQVHQEDLKCRKGLESGQKL